MEVYVILNNRLVPYGKRKWDVQVSSLRPSTILGVHQTQKAAEKAARTDARRFNLRKIEKGKGSTNEHTELFVFRGENKQPIEAYIISRQTVI